MSSVSPRLIPLSRAVWITLASSALASAAFFVLGTATERFCPAADFALSLDDVTRDLMRGATPQPIESGNALG